MTRKHRILVVDDEPSFTRMVKLNLEEAGPYEVQEENHGTRVIRAIEDFRPDLILLDVIMPDAGGAEIAAQLKAHGTWKNIPVVFLTAIVGKQELGPDFYIGGHRFVAKPAGVRELIRAIEAEVPTTGLEKPSAR